MTSLKRIFVFLALGVVALSAILTVVFWTPDTSFVEMKRKYGDGESQFLALPSGDRIHYRDQGVVDGTPLVLIHGTSASLHTWEPLIAQLSDQYRLVSLDLPGHGLTGDNATRDYSRQRMVSSVWALMDHLKLDSASLVGNSLGGSIAWASALDQPQRVNSLILLAPSGAPRTQKSSSNIGFKILGTSFGQAIMKKISPRSIIKASLIQTVVDADTVNDTMVDRYWELLRLKGNRQAMIDLANTPRDRTAWKRFSSISAPTLVIWGENDGLLPVSMISTFEREIKDITAVRLKRVGHIPMEEVTETVSSQINIFCNSKRC